MKKIIGSLLLSPILIGFSAQALAAPAEGITVGDNKHINSTADITVLPGTETPTVPQNPDTPSGETGQNGPLSIDNVIVFNFNDLTLNGLKQNISLKNNGTTSSAKRNIQVTDKRGTGAGWNLQIKQSPLTDETTQPGTTKTLKGSYITLNGGIVAAGEGSALANDPTAFPTLPDYQVSNGNKGEFQELLVAQPGQGLGTFKVLYNQNASGTIDQNPDDIQLVVPSGNLIGTYTGTVTWALSDGPETNLNGN